MDTLDLLAAHPVLTVIAVVVAGVIIQSVRIANQYERAVVFRLGKYNRTAGPRLFIVWLFIEGQKKLHPRTPAPALAQPGGSTPRNVPLKSAPGVWDRIIAPPRALDH